MEEITIVDRTARRIFKKLIDSNTVETVENSKKIQIKNIELLNSDRVCYKFYRI